MMSKSLFRVVFGGLIGAVFCAAAISAQTVSGESVKDRYVISARAGGVNFVEGPVTVRQKDGTTMPLAKGDELQAGDRIITGQLGRAEILLNPGSFARIGGNSSFKFKATALDDLEIDLSSGSAIFEVFASEDFKVALSTPKSKVFLIQTGVYRLDVFTDGTGKLSVIRGRAQLNDSAATVMKKGRSVTLTGSDSQIAKVDSDDKDQLDQWSKARGKELARISRKVDQTSIRSALLSSFRSRHWNMYGSFGLWAYHPGSGYSFLPFGWGWNSPYGYGFGSCIYNYNLPPVIFYPPTYYPGGTGTGTGTGTGGGGAGTGSTNTPIVRTPRTDGGPRPPLASGPPPFVQIQRDTKSGLSIDYPVNNGGGRGFGGGGSGGTDVRSSGGASMPSMPAPAPSMPAPAPTVRTEGGVKKN